MNLETCAVDRSEMLLTKEQLKKILSDKVATYMEPTYEPLPHMEILPAFKKLGVLVDFDEIAEANEQKQKTKTNTKTAQSQSYSCIQCRRQLPTAHLLDLHITEQHDLYFAAGVERGDKPLFACYIEECTVKFHLPSERKDHCITVHKFPANYRFDQGNAGNKVRHRKKKVAANSMDVDKEDVENVSTPKEAQLPYIKAFSFGHNTQRTFNTRQEHAGKSLLDVQAMKDALDEME